ncbi:MAG TPA: STAS domain-containing protein [Terracidiphilus sp.]|nr:STAS domain-containing protein [Terracidiphilus sp.]
MRFEETVSGDVLVVKVMQPRIAADVAGDFKKSLVEAVSRADRAIVLDLTGLTFIDSMGLGGLIAALKALKEDGNLVLCGVSHSILSMFKLTRMDKIFRMFGTAEEAVAALTHDASRPA